jgi:hypothetical protein
MENSVETFEKRENILRYIIVLCNVKYLLYLGIKFAKDFFCYEIVLSDLSDSEGLDFKILYYVSGESVD